MSNPPERIDLKPIAREAMREHGLEPDVPPPALKQLSGVVPAVREPALADLTHLPWCSIDNDDSRDLDQISVAVVQPGGSTKILVGVADVDSLVRLNTPLDLHARANTTSVYTGVLTFPMLPERLSTDLTSLNENADRPCVVMEYVVDADGRLADEKVYRAWVTNKAQLTYHGVSAFLEGKGPLPEAATRAPGVEEQLKIQDAAAQRLRKARHEQGALDLETLQPRPVLDEDLVVDLVAERQDRAQELIEDLMVAANGVTTRYLSAKGFPTFRRVVRSPERWARIVETAKAYGTDLPGEPDARALNLFLAERKKADPLRFPDLCLTVVKLLGRGEYVSELPGQTGPGHFGLAVRDYSHSTAPNRRYPDLVTHRLLKAALAGAASPYDAAELARLADHCTQMENEADKVERFIRKCAGAALLSGRIGMTFDALVTGASEKGTWVRILQPPVEGKVVSGSKGLDVGDRVKVKLVLTDARRGWIDFAATGR